MKVRTNNQASQNLPARQRLLVLTSLIFILAASVTAWSNFTSIAAKMAAPISSISTRTPPNSPTQSYRHTPTPTPTRSLPRGFSFSEIISFYPGAGGNDPCLDNLDFDLGSFDPNTPLIYLQRGHEYDHQREYICLLGFPRGEIVTVRVTAPGGRLAGTYNLLVGAGQSVSGYPERIAIDLLPLNLPNGRWKITAISQSAAAGTAFDHPAKKPSLTLTHSVPSSMELLDPRRTMSFRPEDTLLVQGTNLPAKRNFPLALYFVPTEYFVDDAHFVTGVAVHTDNTGWFQASFVLPKNLNEGKYWVILFTDPKQTFFYQEDTTLRFQVYRPWRPSPDCPPSNLHNGEKASVAFGAGCPRILQTMLLNPGDLVSLISEPFCANGITGWYVAGPWGAKGWLPESINGQPCLLPHDDY